MTKHQIEPLELSDFNFDYTSDCIVTFFNKKLSSFSCAGLDKNKVLALINFLAQTTDESFLVEYDTNDGIPLYITHGLPSTKHYWFNQKAKVTGNHTLSLTLDKQVIKNISDLAKELGIVKAQLYLLLLCFEYRPEAVMNKEHTNFFKAVADIKEFKLFDDESNLPCNLSTLNRNLFLSIKPNQDHEPTAKQIKFLNDLHKDIPHTEKLPFTNLKPQLQDICVEKFKSKPIIKLRSVIKKAFESQANREYENYHYRIKAIDVNGNVVRDDLVPLRFSLEDLEPMYLQNLEYYKSAYLLHVTNTLTEKELIFLPTLSSKTENTSIFLLNISVQFEKWLDFYTGLSNRTRTSFFRQALNNNLHLIKGHLEEFKADPNNDWNDVLKGIEVFKASISD